MIAALAPLAAPFVLQAPAVGPANPSANTQARAILPVIIEEAKEGSFDALVPDLPGCISSADSPWAAAIDI